MTGSELAGVLIGATLLVLGCASVLASILWPRQSTRVLLAFGLALGVYGIRLLAEQRSVRSPIPLATVQWRYLIAFLTYLVNLPLAFFLGGIIGPGWRNTTRSVEYMVAAFAVVAIGTDIVLGRPGSAMPANSWLVLILITVAVGNVLLFPSTPHRHTVLTERIVVAGALIFAVFVINENVGRAVLPDTNIEPVGMLVFVTCLAYAVVRAAFRSEAKFAGVQRELETARQIQLSLLPRTIPAHPGLDIAVRFVPMTAVAGDIYDVVPVGSDSIGLLVADVSGHGIPAALVASMVKVAFAAEAARTDDPAAILTGMNQTLCRHLEHAYVTAVYAVVNTERQTLTIATAGHPPPLLHRQGETSSLTCEHGVMLGVFPDAQYANLEVLPFAPGDRLLLYSDGVIEASDRAGEFFDTDRVARWLSDIPHESADRFAETAFEELTRWKGGAFEDDVTFVIAERTPRSQVHVLRD
jgi:sigma-B regulation protein RsbU (phosphoserine phosphatase)